MTIRTKILLIFLPILITALLITGIITSLSARSGLSRISMQLMGFKAEELDKYVENQWNLLVEYQFLEKPEFVNASKLAIETYARSIIRSDTEVIVAMDSNANILLSTNGLNITKSEQEKIREFINADHRGWMAFDLENRPRVGHMFRFEPFDWYFIISENRDVFYRAVKEITVGAITVLSIAIAASVLFLVVFSSYLTRPVRNMYRTMESIITDRDLTRQVQVEYPDEIGGLANQFNFMMADLDDAYNQVKTLAFKETLAKRGLVQREYETLIVLGKAAEYKDPDTGSHISRVGLYSRMLARLLRQSEERQYLIYYASPLHDIGKLGIPDSILLKPGKLTDDEFELIKTHCQIAYDILKEARSPYLHSGATIALTHHERFDGKGYPNNLKGEEIPLFGRIVGLVDVFDALTSKRPYKDPWPLDKAFDLVKSERGAQFDSTVADLFLANSKEVESIYNDNREG